MRQRAKEVTHLDPLVEGLLRARCRAEAAAVQKKNGLSSWGGGLNSRHVHIKKERRALTVSPPASLVSTQRPPLLCCPFSPHTDARTHTHMRARALARALKRLYPNKDRRTRGCVYGRSGWIGWLVGECERGVCAERRACAFVCVCVTCCPI